MPGWSPLSTRIAQLPLVICGPIVRRTEKDSVSVWIAFRRPVSDIQLRIYDSPNPGQDDAPVFVSAPTAAIQLGDQLHVALLTADQPAPPLITLSPQHIYGYDIILGSENDAGLGAPGILSEFGSPDGDIARITYGSFALPSFVLPAADVGALRLVHGSCRKPHGGNTDALRALDAILTADHADPALRPQQLFLTGDQIYADDVADSLLYMAADASDTLLGWAEPLPGSPTQAQLAAGARRKLVIDAGFSTSDGKSHLIRLGEFYAMYLLVWSDVLWPDDPPDWDDVHPGKDKQEFESAGMFFAGAMVDTKIFAYFKKEFPRLVELRRSLPLVRKALANIASYMVFDDHEVTDDWNLSSSLAMAMHKPDALTRRIIQNALSGFAVFQGWGNLPAEFAAPLQRLAGLHSQRGNVPDAWKVHGDALLPFIIPRPAGGLAMAGGQKWHYTIEFDAYRLVALDTRSHRNFEMGTEKPCLVDDLDVQLPAGAPARELTILLSGAPVIGHPLLEQTLQPIDRKLHGPAHKDFEFWSNRTDCFESLLDRLSTYRTVVMLSGDVHYAFTATLHYWNRRGGTTVPSALAQLCSSALSNEDADTNKVSDDYLFILEPRRRLDFVGWNQPGPHIRREAGRVSIVHVFGHPAVHELETGDSIRDHAITPGDWSYRIRFTRDDRSESARGGPGVGPTPSHPQIRLGYLHNHRKKWDGHRVAIGHDNLGTIRFPEWATTKQVVQELWYAPDQPTASQLRPLTQHTFRLEFPPLSEAPG